MELINDEQFIVQLYPDTFAVVIATYLALSKKTGASRNELDRRMIGVVSSSDRTEILKELRSGVSIDDATDMILGEIKHIDVHAIHWVVNNVGAVITNYCADDSASGSLICETALTESESAALMSSRSAPTPRKPRKKTRQRQCRSARDSTSDPLLQNDQILIFESTADHFSALRIENYPQNTLMYYIISHNNVDCFSSPYVLMFDAVKKNAVTMRGDNANRGCVIS